MIRRYERLQKKYNFSRISPTKIIILGYASIILVGSLLLMLPISSRSGVVTSFFDTLFTATSATCVTGLIVFDTYSYWSLFGQLVILLLIQIGGVGFMTLVISAITLTKRRIGFKERFTMQESVGAPQIGGIVRISKFIFSTALIIELLGALLLSFVFIPEFGVKTGLYFSFFHSISAFCNAGFDLMGIKAPFSSLTSYSNNVLVSLVISALIVVGGIGFFVWDDIRVHKLKFKKYKLHSKIVLVVTGGLILLGFLSFFLFEYSGTIFEDKGVGERLLISFFHAITPRTAGFNTVEMTELTGESQMLTTCLMLIGGSPSSTAGGIKTTTIAVMLLSIATELRNRKHIECFHRRIDDQTVRHAYSVLTMYLLFFITSTVLISAIDHIPVSESIFESASAIGTVGLSLGLTPSLSTPSHMILALLMFIGRVGGLTILIAFAKPYPNTVSQMPVEKITIG